MTHRAVIHAVLAGLAPGELSAPILVALGCAVLALGPLLVRLGPA